VGTGFSVAGLFGPSSGDSFALYAASRSIELLIAVLCSMGFRSREGVASLALVMSLVQAFDGVIGVLTHEAAKTYGPFVLALRTSLRLHGCCAHEKTLRRRSERNGRNGPF
jgi:hypothetical protein